MKEAQYFLNKGKSCSPMLPKIYNYLDKTKFLSEFNTEEARQQVRYNLGIEEEIERLRQIIEAKVIEAGGINWDEFPTEGHTEQVLSSDALYRTFANYILRVELNQILDELSSDYNGKIEKIQKALTYIPKNRGEYEEGERYYKENLVQYKGGTYIADPEDYDIDTNPLAYVEIPPYYDDPELLNPGWGVFARGYSADSSGVVTDINWDDNRKAITKTINTVTSDVVSASKLKDEINPKFEYNQLDETLNIIK